MCVKYAIDHNRVIYVDWSDNIWCHESESFYTYFKLLIPSLNSIDDIPEDATVFPSFWKGRLKTTLTDSIVAASSKEITIGYLKDSYTEDVVVYPCDGYRYVYFDSNFFANVFRITDPRIKNKVRQRQSQYQLHNKIGIHLRGTDRATKISKSKRMAEMNIRLLSSGLLNGAQFICVSDDLEFVNLWKARYPQFPVLTNSINLGTHQGVHTKTKNSQVSKDDLNVDLLVDFLTLASCKYAISTSKDSRFAQESQIFRNFVSIILS
jgi:hypothetical protein